MANGARVSFIADAYFAENGVHALRHREFPSGGPTQGVRISGETFAEVLRITKDGWEQAARIFLSVFVGEYGTDLDVVRFTRFRCSPVSRRRGYAQLGHAVGGDLGRGWCAAVAGSARTWRVGARRRPRAIRPRGTGQSAPVARGRGSPTRGWSMSPPVSRRSESHVT